MKKSFVSMWASCLVLLFSVSAATLAKNTPESVDTVAPNRPELVGAFEKSAQAGNVEAQYLLGGMYLTGKFVAQDYQKARYWFDKAAQANHAPAQIALSSLYFLGQGVAPDEQKARVWLQKAADSGNDRALFGIGLMYLRGEGVSQDKVKAFEWLQKAATAGNVDAQLLMAAFYAKGETVEQNLQKSKEWTEKAALQGHPKAQFLLGLMYFKGEAAQQDTAKAFEWFEKAAQQGDGDAQLMVAAFYARGEVVEKNLQKSREWIEKAAQQGHTKAQLMMGLFYAKGDIVAKDLQKSKEWIEKAAQQGDPDAQLLMGAIYMAGDAVPQDIEKAFFWIQKSAAQGNEKANIVLAKVAAMKHMADLEKTASESEKMASEPQQVTSKPQQSDSSTGNAPPAAHNNASSPSRALPTTPTIEITPTPVNPLSKAETQKALVGIWQMHPLRNGIANVIEFTADGKSIITGFNCLTNEKGETEVSRFSLDETGKTIHYTGKDEAGKPYTGRLDIIALTDRSMKLRQSMSADVGLEFSYTRASRVEPLCNPEHWKAEKARRSAFTPSDFTSAPTIPNHADIKHFAGRWKDDHGNVQLEIALDPASGKYTIQRPSGDSWHHLFNGAFWEKGRLIFAGFTYTTDQDMFFYERHKSFSVNVLEPTQQPGKIIYHTIINGEGKQITLSR